MLERLRGRLDRAMAAWIRRRQGADHLPVRLHRGRIYILPTRAGAGFALLVLFMLIAGLNYANSLALLLTFMLTGFGLVVLHQCHRNLLALAVLDAATVPAFAGEHGTVSVVLGNDSARARCALEVTTPQGRTSVADVLAHAQRRVEVPWATTQRGIARIERLQLATTYPFGLFRAWAWVHAPLELTVYPRPRGSRAPPVSPGTSAGITRYVGADQDEWLGLRPFREGDSPRQVAWKAYARGSALLVKEYAASGSDLRLFDFECMTEPDAEARLEQLARWIVDAEARGEPYGLVLPGAQWGPDHGPEHRHACLAALARHGHAERGS